MKILVIDDLEKNRASAQEQLGQDHDLTIIGSYKETFDYLWYGDTNLIEKLMAEKGFPAKNPEPKFIEKTPWDKAFDKVIKSPSVYWDVVLTDAMMPFDYKAHQHDPGYGEEKMVGYQIAFNAISMGASSAIIFSQHHHQSAEGRILEYSSLFFGRHFKEIFKFTNGTKLGFFQDTGEVKNWKKALEKLLES